MEKDNNVAIRKRTQIAKTNRMMFIWIAIASVIIGVAGVVGVYMVQKLVYNERVLAEKQKTVSTLESNVKVIAELQKEILVLDTNTALLSARASEEDQAIRVVLDALPSGANSTALGASLQLKLLAGIPGLTVESLRVDPVQGVEVMAGGDVVDASSDDSVANAITFQFSVIGDQTALRQVLTNLERSIRTIEITSLRVENQGTRQVMTVQARAFYEPAKTLQLTEKVVQP